jgi:tRNA nucleotidyltransferase (CCA-adding enzyme)
MRELAQELLAGEEAWVVGGAVRDELLGRPVVDLDVVCLEPERAARAYAKRADRGFPFPLSVEHGGWRVALDDGRTVDFLPLQGGSIEADLGTRDFALNAIAEPLAGGDPIDPFDGRGDLQRRLIRAVGDPLQRFREDGLRPMRAVRQATQLEFTIDPPTLGAIGETLDVFRKVSAERIRDELLKLLAAPKPSYGLELMRTTGLLGEVLPELLEGVGVTQNRFHKFDVYRHTLSVVDNTKGDREGLAILRLGALLHDVGKPRARQPREGAPGEYSFFKHEYVGAEMADAIGRRLKLSVADRERIVAMVANHMFFYSPDWTDGTVRRFVRRVGSDAVPALFALREGDIAGRGFGEDPDVALGELRRRISEVAASDAAMRITDLAIDGKDVMRILGVAPGRIVGVVLERLLERVLDDPSLNDAERLSALVPEVAREAPTSASEGFKRQDAKAAKAGSGQ